MRTACTPTAPPLGQVTEAVCGGLRLEARDELLGLDATSHGEPGYDITTAAHLQTAQLWLFLARRMGFCCCAWLER